MDFSSNAAKSKIHARLQAGLAGLDERDKQLAQVKHCCDLLVRGIGVHHGGMSAAQLLAGQCMKLQCSGVAVFPAFFFDL